MEKKKKKKQQAWSNLDHVESLSIMLTWVNMQLICYSSLIKYQNIQKCTPIPITRLGIGVPAMLHSPGCSHSEQSSWQSVWSDSVYPLTEGRPLTHPESGTGWDICSASAAP